MQAQAGDLALAQRLRDPALDHPEHQRHLRKTAEDERDVLRTQDGGLIPQAVENGPNQQRHGRHRSRPPKPAQHEAERTRKATAMQQPWQHNHAAKPCWAGPSNAVLDGAAPDRSLAE